MVIVKSGSKIFLVIALACHLMIPQETSAQPTAGAGVENKPLNVLFIIADDLTATALTCYGNQVCQTPNIDSVAANGTVYRHAYCQFPVCGPSRASFMGGYYPHGANVFGYVSPRKAIGDRPTWSEHFKNNGYHTARISKIYHMGVPGDIIKGSHGTDDKRSWHQRYNSQGPEVNAPGDGERLEQNPTEDPTLAYGNGNHLEYVKADGDDLLHSDGKTAAKACELLSKYNSEGKPFFLAVGFVRPHVPFVAPRSYYEPFPSEGIIVPEKVPGDWDDIPPAGINYKTSKNLNLNLRQEQKAIAAYYASVAYMDAQVGKVLKTLRDEGLEENTIVIFTSDHGFHLGEHEFWMKVSVHEESARVPLIIKVPGKRPAVCDSLVELLDLYPTVSQLCGLEILPHLQGANIAATLDDPTATVRETAFCVNGPNNGMLLRDPKWAFIQYGEEGTNGIELFDMENDPKQYHNLADEPAHAATVAEFQLKLKQKLADVRDNDLTNKK